MVTLRVRLGDKVVDIRALWLEDPKRGIVKMIDQRFLPWKLEFFTSRNYKEIIFAIKEMVVRGAPSIGLAGAYAVLQAYLEVGLSGLRKAAEEIKSARPTAVHLSLRVEQMLHVAETVSKELGPENIASELVRAAEKIAQEEISANRRIGEYGLELIKKHGSRIMTHCNAGALAAIDLGTALAPIRLAHYAGINLLVYVPETRPWLQGARLTAWELEMEGIPYRLIVDSAACYLMWRGDVDLVIVGADRIAANGDVVNKIGTYKLALCAKENGVPFYVAAPLSTFDPNAKSGRDVEIEERSAEEVLRVRGESESGDISSVLIAPKGAKAINPVFDVTPFEYITGIITESGIITDEESLHEVMEILRDSQGALNL